MLGATMHNRTKLITVGLLVALGISVAVLTSSIAWYEVSPRSVLEALVSCTGERIGGSVFQKFPGVLWIAWLVCMTALIVLAFYLRGTRTKDGDASNRNPSPGK